MIIIVHKITVITIVYNIITIVNSNIIKALANDDLFKCKLPRSFGSISPICCDIY